MHLPYISYPVPYILLVKRFGLGSFIITQFFFRFKPQVQPKSYFFARSLVDADSDYTLNANIIKNGKKLPGMLPGDVTFF